jgi:penicillin-binding protein 1C
LLGIGSDDVRESPVPGGAAAVPRRRCQRPVDRYAPGRLSPESSYLVMDMLSDPEARRALFGAYLPLDLPIAIAAKTGTATGFADTVTVAATREAVAAAWAGSFDGSGTKGTLAMWSAAPLVRAALLAVAERAGHPLTLPPAPPGIQSRDVCRITGALPARTSTSTSSPGASPRGGATAGTGAGSG